MDDRHERQAALDSLDNYNDEIINLCSSSAEMLDALEQLGVITEEEKDDANDTEDYSSVIAKLREKIDKDPNFFVVFCRHIQGVDDLGGLAGNLLGLYSSAILSGQSSAETSHERKSLLPTAAEVDTNYHSSDDVPPKRTITGKSKLIKGHLKKLKDQLIVLQGIPSESEETKASKLKMTQTAIKTFIKTSLNLGVDVRTIHMSLENLHTKDTDIVIDGDLYQWCLTELERQNAIHNPESPCLDQMSVQPLNEVNFNKEVLQNSLVACHLLDRSQSNGEDLAHTHSLHELNSSVFLRLEKRFSPTVDPFKGEYLESFSASSLDSTTNSDCTAVASSKGNSQFAEPSSHIAPNDGAAVHQYLIAKGASKPNGHVIYYLAFGSHQSLREWSESHNSFKDGFKKQQEQLPIQFILEKLWEGASVVLTGFSFGGILANLCATHLWSLSQGICPELLEKNLLCITFGQPIISLPGMETFTNMIADKSRFHAIYISDDIIPRMMRYLDPDYTEFAANNLLERFRRDNTPNEMFQNDLSTCILKQLSTLQECNEKHTNMQRVVHHIERNICRKIDQKLDGHCAGEKVFHHLTRRKHRSSDGPRDSLDALQDLRAVLRPLKRQRSNVIPPYVTYVKIAAHGLEDSRNSDFEFPADEEIQEDMFCKHNTDDYLRVLKPYIRKSPVIKFEEADVVISSDFIRPFVKKLEIHHFSHHKTASLSLDGSNLCFTFKFTLNLHRSEKEYEILVDQKESVSSRSIQIHEVTLTAPRDFVNSSDSDVSGDYQETDETANICLHTHFGDFPFENVEVKHKKFFISCRKQQVANLSISEVIELSFLGALLERHPQNSPNSTSKRYKVIQKFLEMIVEVIPIESAYSCIANMNTDQNARHLCQILKTADIKPPLSLTFFVNAALAITKLRGEAIQFDDATTVEDLFHVFVVTAKKRALPMLWFKQSSPESTNEGRYLKWFSPDVASNCRNGDMVKYLQMIVDEAIRNNTGRIPAISGISVKTLFDATEALSARENGAMPARLPKIKSPKFLLREGRRELQQLQTKARDKLKNHGSSTEKDIEMSFTKAHNTILLDYVKMLRSEELHMCIKVIIAFMEEQVRIPISDFNLTVSYWQLLKLGLGIFRRKVSKNVVTQYISVSKHIRSIADGSSQTVPSCETRNVANSKYAGKLQFLLSVSLRQDEPLLVDEKFQMYSLESHLYWRFAHSAVPKHQRIDDLTPLDKIEENWDVLFKDVGLSTIVPSHRRLIARWLKFSLMIHKLRSELSCHATVGIVGLVNSGKSTLVKELFNIDAVETGTREEKRTTVPFLYNIPGVDNFDVIDFPGVDDQDDSISDLVNLLRTLSQLVVFVVNYRNAHTQAAVEWYRKLNQYAIPHLVCLTHGDRLYAECIDEEQTGRDPAYTKKAIKKQVEIIREKIVAKASDSPLRCLELFSLKVDNDSLLKTREGQQNIRDAGIKGVKDVGRWIVKSLEEHLKENTTAQMLNSYLT